MRWVTIFSERAKSELTKSWEWYEERQTGLGDRFATEVFSKIRKLEEDPTVGLRRSKGYYESIISTFPFLIIYRIEHEAHQIFVQSIFHTRRNPQKKYSTDQ